MPGIIEVPVVTSGEWARCADPCCLSPPAGLQARVFIFGQKQTHDLPIASEERWVNSYRTKEQLERISYWKSDLVSIYCQYNGSELFHN